MAIDTKDWGSRHSISQNLGQDVKPVEHNDSQEDQNIRSIVAGIILLGVLGVTLNQNPDRVIDDCAKMLKIFINKNYKH
jgi:hypothetical protein